MLNLKEQLLWTLAAPAVQSSFRSLTEADRMICSWRSEALWWKLTSLDQLEGEPGKKGADNNYSPSIVPESDVDLLVPEMKKMKILRCF